MAAPNEYPASEGLQVVPAHEGLQVVPPQPGLEVAPAGGLEKLDKGGNPAYQGIEVTPADGLETGHKAAATYCGLRKRTFYIVAGIILVAVIVAAVVGGVVGSKNSSKDSSSDSPAVSGSSSTSVSPTSTSSQTTTSAQSTTTSTGPIPTTALALDCPAINETTRAVKSSKSGKSYDFDVYCDANFASGYDIGTVNATSLNDCIQNCIIVRELSATCVGVVWDSILNLALGHNCFLKNETGDGIKISDYVTHPAAALYQA
ncbi:hypothetical protein VE03_04042 [Pseudogymnoascus sp. 23342-1-I1]|nr:hypothetical protein VE03_04042 [Pseudogymnoascus sp. 23342-1-I1]